MNDCVKVYMRKIMGMIMAIFLFPVLAMSQTDQEKRYKVLVVMSYETVNVWEQTVREGIDSVLANQSDVKYFYMDTKRHFEQGTQKAKEAYALYQKFQPDGVIAADDNAQFMFVVPYLKEKVKIPVMFCGLNGDPTVYGYPATNVSGILERQHIRESIVFMQQLVPSLNTIAFMIESTLSGDKTVNQIKMESDTYSVKKIIFKRPRTLSEAIAMAKDLNTQSDALYLTSLAGVKNDDGSALSEKDVVSALSKVYRKPTIASSRFMLEYGILAAMVHRGQEQGETAAKMLLRAMRGTPVSQMPITRNMHGKAVINVTMMKTLGITPRSSVLKGAELVTTQE